MKQIGYEEKDVYNRMFDSLVFKQYADEIAILANTPN